MKHILSLLVLFPLALNAMQEEREEDLLESLTPSYFAEILDANRKQCRPRSSTADGEQFGDYAIKATWKFDNLAKIAKATYTVKRDAQTILEDTTRIEYDTAVLRRVNDEAYLRLIANDTGKPHSTLKEVMYEETTTTK